MCVCFLFRFGSSKPHIHRSSAVLSSVQPWHRFHKPMAPSLVFRRHQNCSSLAAVNPGPFPCCCTFKSSPCFCRATVNFQQLKAQPPWIFNEFQQPKPAPQPLQAPRRPSVHAVDLHPCRRPNLLKPAAASRTRAQP